jgi:hypothetical protein
MMIELLSTLDIIRYFVDGTEKDGETNGSG